MWIIIITILIVLLVGYSIIPTIYYKKKLKKISKTALANNEIVLSFDDGPDEKYTPELLDLLKKYEVKASFFVVAKAASANKEIIERMIEEGHTINLHSLEHKNALFKGRKYTDKDFKESIEIMKKHGWDITYYRPPWGHINLFTLLNVKRYNLKLVMWTVMAEDWSKFTTEDEIARKLMRRVSAGDIICLHDGRGSDGAPERTIKALDKVLPQLINKGYKFIDIKEYYEQ